MLSIFCAGFSKMHIFEVLRNCFSPITYPINSFFPVEVPICKIHVFDETFFPLVLVAMITEKVSFPVYIATTVKETNYFIIAMQLINPNYL